MAVTIYCSQADVEVVWSNFAVDARLDDDFDGSADAGMFDSCAQLVCSRLQQRLFQRYTPASLVGNDWLRWCTAVLIAEFIAIRRGNPIPPPLAEMAKDYREQILAIASFKQDLQSASGQVAEAFSSLPSVSNMTIDGRFQRAKLRRVDSISTGLPSKQEKSNPAIDYYLLP